MNSSENRIIRKIYRSQDIENIEEKIKMLGDAKLDPVMFINIRLITSLVVFIAVLYISKMGYILAPFIALGYYYLYYFVLIQLPLKNRIRRLDNEALHFFEILTLTLESGRNLEKSLEVTISNVNSELSNEFKRVLFEMKFGKSLI